jgi:hypothetical protein
MVDDCTLELGDFWQLRARVGGAEHGEPSCPVGSTRMSATIFALFYLLNSLRRRVERAEPSATLEDYLRCSSSHGGVRHGIFGLNDAKSSMCSSAARTSGSGTSPSSGLSRNRGEELENQAYTNLTRSAG